MSDLVKDLRKAHGSELLQKVILGNHRADVLCLKAAAEIEACWENINTKSDWIEATINDMAAAEEAARASGWQDISTAPKDGTWVLLFAPDPKYPTVDFTHWIAQWGECRDMLNWIDQDESIVVDNHEPTHWMPLPEPPEA